jgi:hypothetical protein
MMIVILWISMSKNYINNPHLQGHVENNVSKNMWQTMLARMCGRPRQQGHESYDLKDHFGCILNY